MTTVSHPRHFNRVLWLKFQTTMTLRLLTEQQLPSLKTAPKRLILQMRRNRRLKSPTIWTHAQARTEFFPSSSLSLIQKRNQLKNLKYQLRFLQPDTAKGKRSLLESMKTVLLNRTKTNRRSVIPRQQSRPNKNLQAWLRPSARWKLPEVGHLIQSRPTISFLLLHQTELSRFNKIQLATWQKSTSILPNLIRHPERNQWSKTKRSYKK